MQILIHSIFAIMNKFFVICLRHHVSISNNLLGWKIRYCFDNLSSGFINTIMNIAHHIREQIL